jgi:hypothetical protein
MKLKTLKVQVEGKEQEVAVILEGMPVLVYDDGREAPLDFVHLIGSVKTTSNERDKLREKVAAAETAAKAFEGLDVAEARKALETVKTLSAKQLENAAEVKRIQDEAQTTLREQLATKEAEHKTTVEKLTGDLNEVTLSSSFGNSKFVADKMARPIPLIRSYFGPYFTVQDGAVVTLVDGKPLMSKQRPGEYANFDEALEYRVMSDPFKDDWIKGPNSAGGGAQTTTATQQPPPDNATPLQLLEAGFAAA